MFSGRKRWQSRKDGIQLVGANERQRRMLKVGELKYTAFITIQYRAAMRIGHCIMTSFDYIYQNALRCNHCNDMTHFTSFYSCNGCKLNSHLTCFRRGFIAQSIARASHRYRGGHGFESRLVGVQRLSWFTKHVLILETVPGRKKKHH